MERKQRPESESRLILLYALVLLDSVSAEELAEFLSGISSINYFDVMLGLTDLEKAGQVVSRQHPLGTLYSITPEGQYALQSFRNLIPHSFRLQMEEAAVRLRKQFQHVHQSPAQVIPQKDGCDCIHLQLLEDKLTLLDLKMILEPDEHMTFIQERWNACALDIYQYIAGELTRGYDAALSASTLPETAQCIPGKYGDWILLLQDALPSPVFSIQLSLADDSLCAYSAQRWPVTAEHIRQHTRKTLCSWTRSL